MATDPSSYLSAWGALKNYKILCPYLCNFHPKQPVNSVLFQAFGVRDSAGHSVCIQVGESLQ